ncbi:5'-methylthioadenosine/adenosylhomocysteine nucleosidase [Buchnera aphidicola]|uniref:5'-methylthioadenosine/adenosylhomocysteine nucleosidase n=1 Tax=Buchnera aphidicola TaxID=9 RepID=UPI00346409E3
MKIGIISAIKEEIKNFKNIIKKYKKNVIHHCPVYTGQFKNINIVLIQSGVGKVSASVATMILINLYHPKYIINVGSAGSLSAILKIGDIIIPNLICYHDVDLTNFGYSLGQIPRFPKMFKNNDTLLNLSYNSAKKLKYCFFKELLISGDSFIRHKNSIKKLQTKFFPAIAVDMEAAAISQVCYQFNIPLIVIKYISDASDQRATVNFKKNVSCASHKTFTLIKNMLCSLF